MTERRHDGTGKRKDHRGLQARWREQPQILTDVGATTWPIWVPIAGETLAGPRAPNGWARVGELTDPTRPERIRSTLRPALRADRTDRDLATWYA